MRQRISWQPWWYPGANDPSRDCGFPPFAKMTPVAGSFHTLQSGKLPSRIPVRATLARLFPFLVWWPDVNRATLRADAMAGLIGALVVLPQGVAFATLAGLPPQYGLYCAMVPTIVAALWGSSRHSVAGPTNAVSLVVFATLSSIAVPGSGEYVSLALTVAFMSGILLLALGLLRAGGLVNFISQTVVVSFTAGIGVLIIASQLPNFFGVEVVRSGSMPRTLGSFFQHIDHLQPWTLVVSLATILGGLIGRRKLPRVPYMISALVAGMVVGTAADLAFGREYTGLVLLGALPSGLPPLSRPEFSFSAMRELLSIAFTVSLLSISQGLTIAKSLANRAGLRLDVNQELIGLGLSNVFASFFSGYPASGSANRAVLNFEAGARTPMSAIFSALGLIAILMVVGPLVSYMPIAAMAGILMLVGVSLVDVRQMRAIAKASRNEGLVLVGTFASTLLLNLEVGIMVGVMLSLVQYLRRTSRPRTRTLVPDPRHPERKFTQIEATLAECPQMKLLRVEGSIYFGAVDHMERHFDTLREVSRGQKHLVLVAEHINFIDLAGGATLADEARRRKATGGDLYLCGARQPAREMLERGGFIEKIGDRNLFPTKREAIAGVFSRLDKEICARCTARIFEECAGVPPAPAQGEPAAA